MKHTGLSKGALRAAALGAALTCATASFAQSFNLDIGGTTTNFGAPSACHLGASPGQGHWNNWDNLLTTFDNLVATDGSTPGVNVTRSSGVGGQFNFNNANATGDFARLLNDAQDIGGVGSSRVYTFTGLMPGTYDVYTYAIAPDSATFVTNVTVANSTSPNPQGVGGAMPINDYVLGITHAHHVVEIGPGQNLIVTAATAVSFGSINGIQLVHADSPMVSVICATGSASPAAVSIGDNVLLTVEVTPAINPPSTGITVVADLSEIGGSASQAFTHQGDNVYTHLQTVTMGGGTVVLPFEVTDDQFNSDSGTINLTIPVVLAKVDGVYTEVETNDSKVTANIVLDMMAGDAITGTTTGSITTGTGAVNSVDHFLVKTSPLPQGIYRHRLVLTTQGAAGHVGTIRGVSQIAAPADTIPGIPWDGVIGGLNPATDIVRQTSITTTNPPRLVQWYGFGKEEQLHYRVHGVAATTEPYFATLDTTPIEPVDIGGFEPGLITMNWDGQGHTTDTSIWVYDGDLNAIPGYGNEDMSATLAGAPATNLRSWLAREYDAGTYYIAVTNFRGSNNQPAASDDNFRTGPLMDFPDIFLTSSSSTGTNLTFTISDSAERSVQVPNTKPEQFGVNWFKFTVGTPGEPCPADLTGSGSVGVADLLTLLASWGPCPAPCPADLTGSGSVGVADLLFLLANWGPCP